MPPQDEAEPGFEDCSTRGQILDRLAGIARLKNDAVLRERSRSLFSAVLTADTTVIAGAARLEVLAKPDGPDWQDRVREWFLRNYFGKTHAVATAVCLTDHRGNRHEVTAETQVTFCSEDRELLEWYLATGDPLGKAGGYGIQSAGEIFVTRIQGSLSNVVGLPLRETRRLLQSVGLIEPGS